MRNGQNHATRTREKIKTSMLVNALVNHVLGKNEMSATQVRAAEILLRKTLPDMQRTEHELEGEGFVLNMHLGGRE